MCDTLIALKDATENGITIFGKNSDRPPNEAQLVEYHPRVSHDSDSLLKCTHISIPQVRETYAVIISRPFWIWGAEMGANEHGVVVGNEAVFSNEEVPENGLLGMDLLRLALERSKNANEALDVITRLLESHGQGGVCEYKGVLMYHNSFIIADKDTAWVLETSDRRWVAKRVESAWAISNGYTIRNSWDKASPDIIEHAIEQGWYDESNEFDFALAYGNEAMRYISRCDDRLSYTTRFLEDNKGQLTFSKMCEVLRSHPEGWSPWNQEVAAVCQHAGHENAYASTCSQISELDIKSTHWFTGASSPCMNLFYPISFDNPIIYSGFDVGDEKHSIESHWWKREVVSRKISMAFADSLPAVAKLVSDYQQQIYNKYRENRLDVIAGLFIEFEQKTEAIASKSKPSNDIPSEFLEYWNERNSEAGLDKVV